MASWRGGRPASPLAPLSLVAILAVVAIDQAAKLLAMTLLPLDRSIDVLPFLTLVRVGNTGIAFSFFAGTGIPLIAVTLIVMVIVVVFWITSGDGGRLASTGFALILGGAIGNLIDRLRLGYVVDFLYLHLGPTTLFVFNLADAALTMGPVILVIGYLWPAVQDPD